MLSYIRNPGCNLIYIPDFCCFEGNVISWKALSLSENEDMGEDWINIHTHKPGRGINIVDPCLGEAVMPMGGQVYYSMGIHPVYIDGDTPRRMGEIERAAAEGRIVAIGEAGIDRNAPVGIEVQLEWLERQAKVAGEYGLPLIIHGVRAIPELISVCKKNGFQNGWIMHGFNNRKEILQDLLRHGFYISAGRHVMIEESNLYQLLPEIPAERLFLETDNSDFGIENIYLRVAERRGESVEELQQNVRKNFEKLFRI